MTTGHNIAKNVGRASYTGRTLPSLLYHSAATLNNENGFVQKTDTGWMSRSTVVFQKMAEETAVGLREAGLAPGDRVGMYMQSDVKFCIVDMGCLMAGLVDVPIYLTHTRETIGYVLEHAQAHALVVSSAARLDDIREAVAGSTTLRLLIVASPEAQDMKDALPLPRDIVLMSLPDIMALGRDRIASDPSSVRSMSDSINPSDLATIIYTSGTTGRPKGVMLTHENLSSNALASFSELMNVRPASDQTHEVSLSFLPLTHVFARSHYYGAMAHGVALFFTTPDDLVVDLKEVRPSILITVPRVLEKVYARIQERSATLGGLQGLVARWGLGRARTTDRSDGGSVRGLKNRLADRLVFIKWREVFGGRLQFLISGGAALNAEIAEVFAGAGIPVLQGYGLTETSPVITFNRLASNRPGTVGTVIPEVEISIADDGEILTRGPHVMAGYFNDEERTRASMDDDGWLHTGDIGTLSEDGYLTITDRKKDLFKLSTGKYVMPQPLENRMTTDPMVDQAVVVGAGHKFASALIFPNMDAVRNRIRTRSIAGDFEDDSLLDDPRIVKAFEAAVASANEGMPPWTTVKRYHVISEELSVENGLLTPTLKIRRPEVRNRFQSYIDAMYADEHDVSADELNIEE
jgi:long-chain acyl-CoA synthetase